MSKLNQTINLKCNFLKDKAYKVSMTISSKNVQELYEISFKTLTKVLLQHQNQFRSLWNNKISTVLTFRRGKKHKGLGLVLPNMKLHAITVLRSSTEDHWGKEGLLNKWC